MFMFSSLFIYIKCVAKLVSLIGTYFLIHRASHKSVFIHKTRLDITCVSPLEMNVIQPEHDDEGTHLCTEELVYNCIKQLQYYLWFL